MAGGSDMSEDWGPIGSSGQDVASLVGDRGSGDTLEGDVGDVGE